MLRTLILALALSGTAAAAQTGDPAKGKATFARCAACHAVVAGKNGVGPSLAGVIGRKAGSAPGYRYSPAMKASGLAWDAATIARFIAAPSKVVKGTKMMAPPVANPQDQANIVAYLKTVSGK